MLKGLSLRKVTAKKGRAASTMPPNSAVHPNRPAVGVNFNSRKRSIDLPGVEPARSNVERSASMKTTMKKLVFAALAAVTLFVLPTRGATSVPYVDEHGANMGSASCTVIASGTKTLSTGWYAVTSNTSNSNRVEVTGSVNLILLLSGYRGADRQEHYNLGTTWWYRPAQCHLAE